MKAISGDMHSTLMESGEDATDARDVFIDLGVLIVEGRVPGGQYAVGRGYGEGPHCVGQTAKASTSARHDCDNSFLCKRAENLRKHMQLLWENNVPMCVEVLLCTDCPCGVQKAQCPEIVNVPSATDVLLEQWLVTMVAKKCVESPQMSARGLLQAVRSQLHFSQLSAWWSSSKGGNPAHINYRVTVPGEAFASQFRTPPLVHSFPVAAVGRSNSIKVSVRTTPRMETVPKVLCNVHHNAEIGAVGGVPEETPNRAEKMLGECLLDPPQSLDHFSRKFQSPSRGGSPSVEALDHLLFPRSCRRENSPPSPPMGLQLHRLGREGLARRRDTSWKGAGSVVPMVDDRMQSVCNRSGKHHCRCDEELEPLPSVSRRLKPAINDTLSQSKQSRSPSASKGSAKDMIDKTPITSLQYLSAPQTSFSVKEPYSEQFLKDGELMEKQVKRVKKEAEGKTGGNKLNLELSPQEFREVLSVIRDRNTTLPHHGTKSLSRSPDDQLGSSLLGYKMKCCASKPVPENTQLVYTVRSQAKVPGPTDKADLFMEAILRSSDNHVSKVSSCEDDEFDLSKKISKISIDSRSRKNSFSEYSINSGTKRKRFDNKSDADDGAGNSHLGNEKDLFESLRSEPFAMERKQFPSSQTCVSQSIDERTLSNVPRTLKINCTKIKSDVIEKVPCDAVSGKKTIKSLNSVINIGGMDLGRTATITANSDIKITKEPDENQAEDSKSKFVLAGVDATKETEHLIKITSKSEDVPDNIDRPVPSASDKEKFRRNLDFAASMVFHSRTGLPLTSSPAPVRRNATCFDYDSTITSVSAIRSALFDIVSTTPSDDAFSMSSDDAESEGRSPCSPRIPFPPVRCMWSRYTHLASSLLGTFEESVLNGRLEPVSTVQGFTANLGASGAFCPSHVTLPVTVFFYTLGDNDKVSTPYLAHINLGKKGYNVPQCGTIQVTLFNPLGTVVKMFVVMYDLKDMPPNSQTFLRQRTLYMPANTGTRCQPDNFQKWLRYLVHLRFSSSKSGRIYLHSDIRMIIFRKSDLDTATAHGVDMSYELRSFTQGPTNPKFSTRK